LTEICTKSFVGHGFAPDTLAGVQGVGPGGNRRGKGRQEKGKVRDRREGGKGRRNVCPPTFRMFPSPMVTSKAACMFSKLQVRNLFFSNTDDQLLLIIRRSTCVSIK